MRKQIAHEAGGITVTLSTGKYVCLLVRRYTERKFLHAERILPDRFSQMLQCSEWLIMRIESNLCRDGSSNQLIGLFLKTVQVIATKLPCHRCRLYDIIHFSSLKHGTRTLGF